jgi:hypothetical protein
MRARLARLALVVPVVFLLVAIGTPAAASASAQTNSPGGEAPGDSTPAPKQGIPQNESGTVPAGGSTGGGSGAPAESEGGSSKAPFVVVLVALALVGGAFVVTRQKRLHRVGAD